jgi:hypothetical protein
MSARTASIITFGILTGLACLVTALLIPVPVWMVFVAWASFFASGGGRTGLVRGLTANLVGEVIAILTILAITAAGGGAWVVAGFAVIAAAILVALGAIPLLSATPAAFLGFAATFGFFLGSPIQVTAPFSLGHPAVLVAGALVMGAIFGIVSEKLIGALATKAPAVESLTVDA